MALGRCPDCDRQISDAATFCPGCGRASGALNVASSVEIARRVEIVERIVESHGDAIQILMEQLRGLRGMPEVPPPNGRRKIGFKAKDSKARETQPGDDAPSSEANS